MLFGLAPSHSKLFLLHPGWHNPFILELLTVKVKKFKVEDTLGSSVFLQELIVPLEWRRTTAGVLSPMVKSVQERQAIRVLLLENNPADAELCIHELDRAGLQARVSVVHDLEGFRLKLGREQFDIILSDYNLDGATGLEAFDFVKSKSLQIPFILVTGAIGDEVAVECMKRGISDYVLKDRLARLPVAIRRAIHEENLRRERAEAERLLFERERRFRALMEHSKDGIVLLNRDGEIIFVSHEQPGVLGYPPSDVMGRRFFELIHPEDLQQAKTVYEELSEQPGSSATAHFRFRAKDGYWRWLECIAINLLAEPVVGGIAVNYRDISDRKHSEDEIRRLNDELEDRVEERTAELEAANRELEAEIIERRKTEKILGESQERFQLLVDGLKDYAIFMLDAQGKVASWNAGAERIYGYRTVEITARDFSCFYCEEDVREGKPGEHKKISAATGRIETEGWRIRKDGTHFWANVVITALYDAHGKLRGFSKITRDITERRRTEQALERLRQQQALILNSAGDGICGVDDTGACTFINASGARMLGWEQEQLIGRPLHDSIHHRKLDGILHSSSECKIMAALRDDDTHHGNDEVFWRKDGANFPVDYVSTPMRNEQGNTVGAVVVFHDVTERRAMERMKDEFISVVSHELRTPLTAIRGALGLLASGKLCGAQDGCRKMIEIAVSNAGRLARLVNDILDLERIESGKAKGEEKACSAEDLMRQAADLMRVTAEAQEISLDISPVQAFVRGNPDRILQVLINLLGNAVKFSPCSSTVRLSAEPKGQQVVFCVKDQGRGIPVGKLSAIFEKFHQVDASDSRDKGGTGLGLAICRSIVTQHGGRIWVDSTVGQGSTFCFTLPRACGPVLPGKEGNPECIEKSSS